jgi:hypothetical protein
LFNTAPQRMLDLTRLLAQAVAALLATALSIAFLLAIIGVFELRAAIVSLLVFITMGLLIIHLTGGGQQLQTAGQGDRDE